MSKLKNKKAIARYILLIFILFLGLLLRSKDYLRGDFNYSLDQSRDLLLVKQIVESKHITLIGARAGLQGIFHGPLWLYILVPTYVISKGDPFWTLIPIFTLFNILLILGSFWVGKKLYGNIVALFFAFFVAVSKPIIQASFTITNAHMIMILFLIYLYYAIRYMRGYQSSAMALLFLTGLAFQFESAFAVFLILLTVLIFILTKKFLQIRYFLIGLGLFTISVFNFFLFEIRHQFLMTHSALQLISGKIGVMHGYEQYSNILFRLSDRLNHFINFFFVPLYNLNLIFKILTVVIFILFLLHINNKKLKQTDRKELIFLFSIPLIYFIIFILYPYPLWEQYLFGMFVLSCLIFAIVMNEVIGSKIGKAYLILTLIFPLFFLVNYYFHFQNNHLGSYLSQKQVADWVVNDSNNYKIGYFVYDSGLLTYNMDYLMFYTAKNKNKSAVNEKLSITYLIMYAAPSWNKGAHEYWKENVVKTKDKVIETKKFPDTDLIVEKIKTGKNEQPPDPNYFQNLIFR